MSNNETYVIENDNERKNNVYNREYIYIYIIENDNERKNNIKKKIYIYIYIYIK